MQVTTVAIDLAKNVFALCGADAQGRVVLRKELRRAQLPDFMRGLGPCVVGKHLLYLKLRFLGFSIHGLTR